MGYSLAGVARRSSDRGGAPRVLRGGGRVRVVPCECGREFGVGAARCGSDEHDERRVRRRTPRTSTTRPAVPIVVDVVGAVRHVGVFRLTTGSRVVDAITAAGGSTPDADLARLNLAAVVADGSRIAVPRVGAPALAVDPAAVSGAAPAAGSGGAPSSDAPVNLNSATAEQLDTLPGVGPATAAAIVQDRTADGPFRSVNDLGRVRGIGDAKLQQLRDLVTV